ncbi:gas vesicle protein [Nostoc sp. CENA543]|uniref:gas vesicle protein GvpG n=1 Tax=Nostoc sp. CENA543 TaxID=1869241 RepID=UPI000CA13D18|nr:gas vesicle protein GvpG [Nostoc sp. CENA543]AUS99990.1 gas vesicle protein [Nostoc sp. CENA543]
MLGKILLFPVMGPISGLVWIGEQIQERANTEFDAKENLHKQLLSLQLSFDMGEISEEEFEEKEEELLLRIQALEEELNVDEEVAADEDLILQPALANISELNLDEEVEADEDLILQPALANVSELNEIYQETPKMSTDYEDKENLVLSP